MPSPAFPLKNKDCLRSDKTTGILINRVFLHQHRPNTASPEGWVHWRHPSINDFPKPSTSKAYILPYFGCLYTAYFFKAASTSFARSVHSLPEPFSYSLFAESRQLCERETAKKLEGTRNWKVVASSDGRKVETIRPTGFTGFPNPLLVTVSSARFVYAQIFGKDRHPLCAAAP